MLKKLLHYVRGYVKTSVLTPIVVMAEVVLEVFIPLYMSRIIDVGIPNADLPYVLKTGGVMVLMALGALLFGGGELFLQGLVLFLQGVAGLFETQELLLALE